MRGARLQQARTFPDRPSPCPAPTTPNWTSLGNRRCSSRRAAGLEAEHCRPHPVAPAAGGRLQWEPPACWAAPHGSHAAQQPLNPVRGAWLPCFMPHRPPIPWMATLQPQRQLNGRPQKWQAAAGRRPGARRLAAATSYTIGRPSPCPACRTKTVSHSHRAIGVGGSALRATAGGMVCRRPAHNEPLACRIYASLRPPSSAHPAQPCSHGYPYLSTAATQDGRPRKSQAAAGRRPGARRPAAAV